MSYKRLNTISYGSALPFWTPCFLLCLLILSSVWGMPLVLNRQALEHLFHHEQAVNEDQCPAEQNHAVKAFLSWPNEQVNQEQAGLDNETNLGMIFDKEGVLKKNGEEPVNSQTLQLKPAIEAKEVKDEVKVQENGIKGIAQAPQHEILKQGIKSSLISRPLIDFKQEFASDEANPYVEGLQQR